MQLAEFANDLQLLQRGPQVEEDPHEEDDVDEDDERVDEVREALRGRVASSRDYANVLVDPHDDEVENTDDNQRDTSTWQHGRPGDTALTK